MISLWGFCEAINTIVKADATLAQLDVKGAFYQMAPEKVAGEFVVHQMQSGSFDRTIGEIQDVRFTWQLCAMAGERDGQSPIKRADAISLRLFEMFDKGNGEDLMSEALESLGFECELSRAVGFVPPLYQQVGGAQKWKCGHIFEWMLQPTD